LPSEGRVIQYQISNFSLGDMLRLGLALRPATDGKGTMEEAANALCRLLYEELVDGNGHRACALVRFYKTHSFGELPRGLQTFASKSLAPVSPRDDMNCLTLLATVGDEPAWNSRHRSRGHQAIPLASPEVVEGAPMIAQLIKQFGMDVREVVRSGDRVVRDLKGRNYGVFYVPKAPGSPYIPAQTEFVLRYGIQSVLGFGGTLVSGDLFALILFSKTPIQEGATEQFRRLAADVRVILGKYKSESVFS
jgi:hypothetical protein